MRELKAPFETFEEALAAQGKVCAVCQQPNSNKREFHIDHDHATGLYRGLLCHGCNVGLGAFKDDAWTLSAAVRYLQGQTNDLGSR